MAGGEAPRGAQQDPLSQEAANRTMRLETLAAASEKFSRLADSNLDLDVKACPGWSVADLVGHLGGVYSWVVMVMAADGERPTGQRQSAPSDLNLILEWFAERRSSLLASLSSRPYDAPAWTFSTRTSATTAWWLRRQAAETAIHLHDMEEAVSGGALGGSAGSAAGSAAAGSAPAGSAAAVSPLAAADGVDEVLTDMAPSYLDRNQADLRGSLHVHATDTPGEWTVDFDVRPVDVRREHAKGSAAVRGPARDLFLWLWNRRSLDEAPMEVFGDLDVARSWEQIRI